MLSILGKPDRRQRLCNGISRRDVLRIGGLGMGGLTLPQLLQLEAQAGERRSHKAVIMIYLCGGHADVANGISKHLRHSLDTVERSVVACVSLLILV